MDAADEHLRAHIARLEQRIAELEQGRSAPARTEPETTTSRRNLFRLGAVGVAGAAVAAVSRPTTAAAACTPLYADCPNEISYGATISSRSERGPLPLLWLSDEFQGAYCWMLTPDDGLRARSPAGDGVTGTTKAGRYGVHGEHEPRDGLPAGTAGVYGEHQNADSNGTGVIGKHWGAGWGMWAISASGKGLHADGGSGTGAEGVTTGATSTSFGVIGRVTSTNPHADSAAVRASTASTNAGSYAIRASHAGTGTSIYGSSTGGTGVRGVSANGRGGVFSGAKAQINLTPGSLNTHPAGGQRGDLYLDSNGRLWLCKTTGSPANWNQLG